MERTTISLPRDLIVKLRVMAAERRTSMAAIIREAIEKEMRKELATKASEAEKPYKRRKLRSLGIADSGYTDTSRLASERPIPPVSWR